MEKKHWKIAAIVLCVLLVLSMIIIVGVTYLFGMFILESNCQDICYESNDERVTSFEINKYNDMCYCLDSDDKIVFQIPVEY